jgi:hypothetical protein
MASKGYPMRDLLLQCAGVAGIAVALIHLAWQAGRRQCLVVRGRGPGRKALGAVVVLAVVGYGTRRP